MSNDNGGPRASRTTGDLNAAIAKAAVSVMEEMGLRQSDVIARSERQPTDPFIQSELSKLLAGTRKWSPRHMQRFCRSVDILPSELVARAEASTEPNAARSDARFLLGIAQVGNRSIDEREWVRWLRGLYAANIMDVAAEMVRVIEDARARRHGDDEQEQ